MSDISLKTALEEIWENRVIPLYEKGKIQTERHLQAYLFMWLKEIFDAEPGGDWDVWVEPQVYFKENGPDSVEKMYKPDLVVTKGKDIAGFIELKFSPQQHNIEKNIQAALGDIEKLDRYRAGLSSLPELGKAISKSAPMKQLGDCFLLELEPNKGSYCEPAYLRTENTIYAFLGVARYGDTAREALLGKSQPESEREAKKRVLLIDTEDRISAHP